VVDGWWAEAYSPEVGWALEGLDDAVVVTHGTVLSLFLGYDFERWNQIALPDVIEWRA